MGLGTQTENDAGKKKQQNNSFTKQEVPKETGTLENSELFMAEKIGNFGMQNVLGIEPQKSGLGFGRGGDYAQSGSQGRMFSSPSPTLTPLNAGEAPVQAKKNKGGDNAQAARGSAPASAPAAASSQAPNNAE
ncbi:MAG: hypothetical protein IJC39_00685, partial [Firmicutes bacterium]|nr:hypothetical protein [Bacillota bacterium]